MSFVDSVVDGKDMSPMVILNPEYDLPINDFLLLQRKSFKNKKAHSFRGGSVSSRLFRW